MKRLASSLLLLALAAIPSVSNAAINAHDAVPAATLLLPHFEADLADTRYPGPITVMRVGNATPAPVLAHVTLWTDHGVPTRAFDLYVGGNDVVTIDLRLLMRGVVPQRATSPWNGNVGSASTGPVAFPSCPASWLEGGRLSAADVAALQAAHTGQPSALLGGLCGGRAWGDGIARGYVTVDAVNRCSTATTFPGSAGYFAEGGTGIASNRNVLFGDWAVIDRANNHDVADTLVHVEASRDATERAALGAYTFYGRLASVNGTGIDNREALFAQWMTRYVNGGLFDDGTRAVVWRDPGPQAAFACATPPALDTSFVAAFDEEESAAGLSATFPLASEAVDLGNGARIPIPFPFGFLSLDLSLATPRAPFGRANQAWVGTRFLAQGRFATAFTALPLVHVSRSVYNPPVEVVERNCADGVDNDGDGHVDFPADPGCRDSAGMESPACDDDVDNDGDGQIDAADSACTVPWWTNESGPPPTCSNGLDDDGDGRVDYPNDPGCYSPWDGDETNPQCVDGLDNDNDGLVDYPADTGCSGATDDSEAPSPSCSDGVDNDGDTFIDYPADPGCASERGSVENPACDDDADNDGDSLIDFPADPGCTGPAGNSENTPECSDGRDNDSDGRVDYPADPGCTSWNDATEAPDPQCLDGIDNDGNGVFDFPNDPGCAEPKDAHEVPDCSDGEGGGDYPANPGCASALDQNEKPGTTTRQCSDGVDNDGDGLVDYPADPGCISRYDDNEVTPS